MQIVPNIKSINLIYIQGHKSDNMSCAQIVLTFGDKKFSKDILMHTNIV